LQDEISDIWQRTRTTVLWVTNDPDEALLLSDRVIPLLPTSPAILGEPMTIDLPRPRDRRSIGLNADFKAMRLQLVTTLLAAKADARATTTAAPPRRPDILPEDLTRVNSLQYLNRSGPRRRATPSQEAAA
jgi:nitrate/nitrite transport system ATP-binding protein